MAFGGFNQGGHDHPVADINTTPLVDVMLVLLVIFLVTAPLLQHKVPVTLPKASSTPAEEPKPETITLGLKADGGLYWNDAPLSSAELEQRLQQTAQQTPAPEVRLLADRDLSYDKLAQVMAMAQRSGVQKLGFVTQQP